MKPKLKNQTTKRSYTIVIYNDEGELVDRRTAEAESPREAIKLAFRNIFSE